jgi:hypothetical protein
MSRPSSFDVTEIIHRRPPLKMPVKLSISFLKLYAPLLTEIQNAKEARKREFNIYIYIFMVMMYIYIHSLIQRVIHTVLKTVPTYKILLLQCSFKLT